MTYDSTMMCKKKNKVQEAVCTPGTVQCFWLAARVIHTRIVMPNLLTGHSSVLGVSVDGTYNGIQHSQKKGTKSHRSLSISLHHVATTSPCYLNDSIFPVGVSIDLSYKPLYLLKQSTMCNVYTCSTAPNDSEGKQYTTIDGRLIASGDESLQCHPNHHQNDISIADSRRCDSTSALCSASYSDNSSGSEEESTYPLTSPLSRRSKMDIAQEVIATKPVSYEFDPLALQILTNINSVNPSSSENKGMIDCVSNNYDNFVPVSEHTPPPFITTTTTTSWNTNNSTIDPSTDPDINTTSDVNPFDSNSPFFSLTFAEEYQIYLKSLVALMEKSSESRKLIRETKHHFLDHNNHHKHNLDTNHNNREQAPGCSGTDQYRSYYDTTSIEKQYPYQQYEERSLLPYVDNQVEQERHIEKQHNKKTIKKRKSFVKKKSMRQRRSLSLKFCTPDMFFGV